MRGFSKLPKKYFEKFSDNPVEIRPFNPQSRKVAADYIKKLKELLSEFNVDLLLRGSTAFGIAGKGEIEIGVYPEEKDWDNVLAKLKNIFGKVDNLEENYARFNDMFGGFEIEIILMKGRDALVDKKLTDYLISHPRLLKKYEKIKYEYAFSKKEYMIQKNKFFEKVIKII